MNDKKKPWNYQADSVVKCDTCGNEIRRPKSQLQEHNYCCRKCYTESKKKQVGDLHPLYNRIESTCDTCGKTINLTNTQYNRAKNHFCSLECKHSYVEESNAKQGYKICTKCGKEIKATPEYFYRDGQTRDGLSPQCKECRNAEILESYPNFEARRKSYRVKNKEKLQEYRKKYYKENIDKIKAHYEEHKHKYKIAKDIYYQNNKEKIKEQRRTYQKFYNATERGKEVQRKAQHRRRARQNKLIYDFTPEQWEYAKSYFNFECAYCGMTEEEHYKEFNEQLHQEHFIPVTENGNHTKDNIIPACRRCNGGKRNDNFYEWYPKQSFYNKSKEKKILTFIENQKDETNEFDTAI